MGPNFKSNERDWIIFKKKKNAFIRQICIGNLRGTSQDVKTMQVFIGDGDKKWIECKSNGQSIINVANTKEMQTFDIEVESAKYEFVKVEFIDNYGFESAAFPRFCVRRFGVRGIDI